MVKEKVPPYAGGSSSSPEACALDGSLRCTAGMPKRLPNAVLPYGFPGVYREYVL